MLSTVRTAWPARSPAARRATRASPAALLRRRRPAPAPWPPPGRAPPASLPRAPRPPPAARRPESADAGDERARPPARRAVARARAHRCRARAIRARVASLSCVDCSLNAAQLGARDAPDTAKSARRCGRCASAAVQAGAAADTGRASAAPAARPRRSAAARDLEQGQPHPPVLPRDHGRGSLLPQSRGARVHGAAGPNSRTLPTRHVLTSSSRWFRTLYVRFGSTRRRWSPKPAPHDVDGDVELPLPADEARQVAAGHLSNASFRSPRVHRRDRSSSSFADRRISAPAAPSRWQAVDTVLVVEPNGAGPTTASASAAARAC